MRDNKIQLDDKKHCPLVHHQLKVFQQRWQKQNDKKVIEINESDITSSEKAKKLKEAKTQTRKEFSGHYSRIKLENPSHPVIEWLDKKENDLWKELRRDYCEKLDNTLACYDQVTGQPEPGLQNAGIPPPS